MTKIKLTLPMLLLLGFLPLMISCGDFKDEPQPPPSPQPEKPITPPPVPPQTETREQKMYRLCEAERLWVHAKGDIDDTQLELFSRRNFAPVYNTPGVRQSGIGAWVGCEVALVINGFIEEQKKAEAKPAQIGGVSVITGTQTEAHGGHELSTTPATEEDKYSKICDEERLYVYRNGYIDRYQLKFFRRKDFAPVYEIPGVRDSGVESWINCLDALEINGFIDSSQINF